MVEALDDLVAALEENARLNQRAITRAREICDQRRRGLAYGEIVPSEDRPLIVEMMRESSSRLIVAASRFQRLEARALHAEGMTMEQIGALFGLTRQRVSALLKDL